MEDNNRKIFNTDDDILRRMKDVANATIVKERAIGSVNGGAKTFFSSSEFLPESLEVYRDGDLMAQGSDYHIITQSSIAFNVAPGVESIISLSYKPV